MLIRNALIALAAGLCLIGLIGIGAVWEIYRNVQEVENIDSYNLEPCGEECTDCHPTQLKAGELDADGNMVGYIFAGNIMLLESDYALVHSNDGTEQNPVESFELISRESGYEKFTTLEALVERIEQISEPRILDTYSSCGGPPWYTLPQESIDALKSALTHLQVELRSIFTCTCPCPNSK